MQEVSSAVQTQAWKRVVITQTATQGATQRERERVIQIQTIDYVMLFYQQLTIMRSNVLLQAQAKRQTQTTSAIKI